MYSSVPRSGNWWSDTSYDGMFVTQQVHNHDKLIYAYAVRLRLNNRPTHEIWIVMVANSVLCSLAGLSRSGCVPTLLASSAQLFRYLQVRCHVQFCDHVACRNIR